ncbi:MAG: antitoxin [Phycisphaeraceae bacterium]|nr:antitoxin [Phycisphaerales bacterium]MCB9859095.1 antitoxin [Phycisphaeraceae bacterium]
MNRLTSYRATSLVLAVTGLCAVMLAGCSSSPENKAEQKAERASNRTESKVDQKIDQKTDNVIDKGIDKVFNW